jgi:hypothetical protein
MTAVVLNILYSVFHLGRILSYPYEDLMLALVDKKKTLYPGAEQEGVFRNLLSLSFFYTRKKVHQKNGGKVYVKWLMDFFLYYCCYRQGSRKPHIFSPSRNVTLPT